MTLAARLALLVLAASLLYGAPTRAVAGEGLEPRLLERAFPDTDAVEPFSGTPPAAPVYRGGTLVGYLLSTSEVIGSVGYSGKPLDVLVGLGLDGVIRGAAIREQHEPILIIGIAPSDLDAFVSRYAGVDIRNVVSVAPGGGRGAVTIDGVTGASVSSLVINDAILRAARVVARAKGILGGAARLDLDSFEPAGWSDLLAEGSIKRLALTNAEAGAVSDPAAGVRPDDLFIELFATLATPARIGRNLLGDRTYNRLMAELPQGGQAVIVASRGRYSFKGTDYVRSGRFERIQIVQGDRTFRPAAADHERIEGVAAADAPEIREAALFTIPPDFGFDPAQPWRLELLVDESAGAGARYRSFALPYELPARYRLAVAEDAGPPPSATALWREAWTTRVPEIAVLSALLLALTLILVFQDAVAVRPRLYFWLRTGFLAFVVVWLGWYAGAQLSVVNVLTFVQAVRTEFRWEFFLVDPLMFILWSYVAVGMIFLGRGVFCGWLCPFGALQELLNTAARALRIPQVNVPFRVHERLWPIKYIIFLILFALSFYSLDLTVLGAEVEPFKTAIVLRFARYWPFVLFPAALLVAGLFIERFYCRYLCPLGGALALPARLRMFEWLKRRWQCGRECHICASRCTVQAIHPDGHINPNECIHCLNCQVLYHDDKTCPPLIDRRKRREGRAALRAARTAAAGGGGEQ